MEDLTNGVDGGPAFPCHTEKVMVDPKGNRVIPILNGDMSLRDYFAANAPPVPEWFPAAETFVRYEDMKTNRPRWRAFADERIEKYLHTFFTNGPKEMGERALDFYAQDRGYISLPAEFYVVTEEASKAVTDRAAMVLVKFIEHGREIVRVRRAAEVERAAVWRYTYADGMLAARIVATAPT